MESRTGDEQKGRSDDDHSGKVPHGKLDDKSFSAGGGLGDEILWLFLWVFYHRLREAFGMWMLLGFLYQC